MSKEDLFKNSSGKLLGDLTGKFKLSWVEGALDIDPDNQTAKNIVTPHTRTYLGTHITPKKIYLFLAILICGLALLLSRIFYLQIIKGSYYYSWAENNRLRIIPIAAERGIIYDRFNKELVQNIPNFYLSIVPQGLPNAALGKTTEEKKQILEKRAQIVQRVSELSGFTPEEIEKKLEKYSSVSYQSLRIKENLDYHDALKLYLQNSDLPGILIENGSKRSYPTVNSSSTNSQLGLSSILGYLGKIDEQEWGAVKATKNYLPSDDIGKTGLEKFYESDLRGTYGHKKIEVDALEREQSVLAVEPPHPGKNIYLSIDLEGQQKLEEIIHAHLTKIHKEKATAIALNPKNGEILAMVNYPSFNNNDFSGGISSAVYKKYLEDKNHPLFNRAITGVYPPGSTLKLVIAASALEEKIITLNTTFNSTGGLRISRWFFPDWKAGGHGLTNVTKAIAWSVNTFFYYIGGGYADFEGLGAEKIFTYLKKFNLAQNTGIDLPGESSGFIPSKEWKQKTQGEQWFIGDTYNTSIGQGGTLVTPLQAAVWTSVFANGGKIIQPHLVTKLTDPETKNTAIKNPPPIKENFLTPETVSIVKSGMRECVLDGSCKLLQNLPFTSGGKTGTAQWNKNFDTHAWFTTFAPYNDPQIVVTVLVEEGGEGASAAMPIADQFLAWWGHKYLTPNSR
jgi:penicillin-binding protein 2